MPPKVPSPRILRADLGEITSLADELHREVRDVYDVTYGRNPPPDGLGHSQGEQPTEDEDGNPLVNPLTRSDPTGDSALGNKNVKHHYHRAGKAIQAAKTELRRAKSAFKSAVSAADALADARDPEGIYGPPPPPPDVDWQVSDDELREIQARNERRTG